MLGRYASRTATNTDQGDRQVCEIGQDNDQTFWCHSLGLCGSVTIIGNVAVESAIELPVIQGSDILVRTSFCRFLDTLSDGIPPENIFSDTVEDRYQE